MNRHTRNVPLSFEQLVSDHSGRIRRIARRFAQNGAVDDLVQDILRDYGAASLDLGAIRELKAGSIGLPSMPP